MCYASDVIEYDESRPELPNVPLQMKQDNSSIEKYTLDVKHRSTTYDLPASPYPYLSPEPVASYYSLVVSLAPG